MPTWGEILTEVTGRLKGGDTSAFDFIRKKYLVELNKLTGRNTILYASRWTSSDLPPNLISINDEDVQGFMEAINGLKGDELDLILHTGGGSAESTDAIVSYLRQKFKSIRVIIPQAAMSAGTMLACSADVIVMGRQSSLGPIDPQFILQTSVGVQALPAHAILEQFEKAQKDIATNPQNIHSWLPMLSQYGPALLVRCQDQIEFGKRLVESWLGLFMFKADPKSKLPHSIAEYLSTHSNFKTHSKHLNIDEALKVGLKIEKLEDSQDFQEKVLSAFHAAMLTLSGTNTAKIIANHNGNAFIKTFAAK